MEKGGGARIVSDIRNMPQEYCANVPIVFTTTADINDVFTGFLEAGFNDYLQKPVSKRSLGSVLTRWLWQRFENGKSEEVSAENRFSSQYNELCELLADAEKMLVDRQYDLFGFCLKGIERDSRIIGLSDIADLASDLSEAVMLEDTDRIDQLFNKMRAGIRDAVTIK